MDKYFELHNKPKWVTHSIAVKLQLGSHKGTVIVNTGLDDRFGQSVLDLALTVVGIWDFRPDMGFEQNKKHIKLSEENEGYAEGFFLFDDDGNEVFLNQSECGEHIVGTEIIDYKEISDRNK